MNATKEAVKAGEEDPPLEDRFRVPIIRHALIVRIPDVRADKVQHARVEVTEMRESVRLAIYTAGSEVETAAVLTLSEARAIADHLNKIATRIAKRPAHRP